MALVCTLSRHRRSLPRLGSTQSNSALKLTAASSTTGSEVELRQFRVGLLRPPKPSLDRTRGGAKKIGEVPLRNFEQVQSLAATWRRATAQQASTSKRTCHPAGIRRRGVTAAHREGNEGRSGRVDTCSAQQPVGPRPASCWLQQPLNSLHTSRTTEVRCSSASECSGCTEVAVRRAGRTMVAGGLRSATSAESTPGCTLSRSLDG
jgi:hypothetical protein